ncbi:MAG TPA: phosphate ABC transporter substrate-binding protein [Cytophagaceae bacterium]|jgi:phosphate transport system substrate-binding protein|nr:phosphate ABC transporter substrate-binding protein [Cytophagaceae bacterium]
MNKIKLLLLAIIIGGCQASSKENLQIEQITIKGSETMYPLSKELALEFENENKHYKINVTGGGSETGISALKQKKTDIAMSSRSLKLGEKLYFQEDHFQYHEKIIAYDALAVICNNKNILNELTIEQIRQIYTGKIKNWKEIGGEDLPVILYSREPSSGTYDFFNEFVLNNERLDSNVIKVPNTEELSKKINQNKGAIGYIGLGHLNKSVKAMSVSSDGGTSYTEPSQSSVQNRKYPVIRPLYFYYLSENELKLKAFINYVLSEEGQNVVLRLNYVPLKNYMIQGRILPPL